MTPQTDLLLLAASIVAMLTGAVHSVLGEYLIFRHLRTSGVLPTADVPPLKRRHLRIIWASWHIVTIFGWLLGAFLLEAATGGRSEPALAHGVALATATSGLLVLYATRGRHPGWAALLTIAGLVLASAQ